MHHIISLTIYVAYLFITIFNYTFVSLVSQVSSWGIIKHVVNITITAWWNT